MFQIAALMAIGGGRKGNPRDRRQRLAGGIWCNFLLPEVRQHARYHASFLVADLSHSRSRLP
jgi:hypothetical protein